MPELLSIETHPPFDPDIVHGEDTLAEVRNGLALGQLLGELPASSVAQESVVQTAAPEESRRIVDATPFLGALRDELADVIDYPHLSGPAYRLGCCLGAITLEHFAGDSSNSAIFEDGLRERVKKLRESGASEYRPEDRQAVLLQTMSMLDADLQSKADALMKKTERKVQLASLPLVAMWAGQHLRSLSDIMGYDAGTVHNPWDEGLIDTEDEYEAIQGILDNSSFAEAMLNLIGEETLPDPEATPITQCIAGINRVLAFVMVGADRLAALNQAPGEE